MPPGARQTQVFAVLGVRFYEASPGEAGEQRFSGPGSAICLPARRFLYRLRGVDDYDQAATGHEHPQDLSEVLDRIQK